MTGRSRASWGSEGAGAPSEVGVESSVFAACHQLNMGGKAGGNPSGRASINCNDGYTYYQSKLTLGEIGLSLEMSSKSAFPEDGSFSALESDSRDE